MMDDGRLRELMPDAHRKDTRFYDRMVFVKAFSFSSLKNFWPRNSNFTTIHKTQEGHGNLS